MNEGKRNEKVKGGRAWYMLVRVDVDSSSEPTQFFLVFENVYLLRLVGMDLQPLTFIIGVTILVPHWWSFAQVMAPFSVRSPSTSFCVLIISFLYVCNLVSL